jgi:alkyl sulfatase BDS1-like metallo-beta-lactamase superfamily hydrolase
LIEPNRYIEKDYEELTIDGVKMEFQNTPGTEAPAKNPDLKITINRSDLELVVAGMATFDSLLVSGKARFDGDRKPFDQLRSIIVRFTPDFELMPGTRSAKPITQPTKDPFEVHPPAHSTGG